MSFPLCGSKKGLHLPSHSQDLVGNSPSSLMYNSYAVSSENLALDQLLIP